MKYFLKIYFKNLPMEVIDKIYSYIDLLTDIKNVKDIWYKRLINNDYKYYSPFWYKQLNDYDYKNEIRMFYKLYLKNEERQLKILIKNKAFNLIKNIHYKNLNIEL